MEAPHITLVDDPGCELVRQLASSGPAVVWLVSARREADADRQNYFIFKIYRSPSRETWAAEENEVRVLARLFKQFVPGIPKPVRRLKYHDPAASRPGENAGGGLFRLPHGQDWDSLGAGWSAGRDFRAVFGWIHGLCDLLQGVHEAGVIHGGINPGNVLWDEAEDTFCLIDFTAAVFAAEGEAGPAPARLPYTSPEWLAGGPSRFADDVYALGVTLFEWLAGQGKFPVTLDWSCADNHLLARQLAGGLRSFDARTELAKGDFFQGDRAILLPPLAALVQKCLHADPARRYQKVGPLLADFRELERTLPEWARRPVRARVAAVAEDPGPDEAPALAAAFTEPAPLASLPDPAPLPPPAPLGTAPAPPVGPSAVPRFAGPLHGLEAGTPVESPVATSTVKRIEVRTPEAVPTRVQPVRRRLPLALMAGAAVVVLAGAVAILSLASKNHPAATSTPPVPAANPGGSGPVASAPVLPPATTAAPAPNPNSAADARRAAELTTLLDQARAALAKNDDSNALTAALAACQLSPENPAASNLVALAQGRLDQFHAVENTARAALAAGDLAGASNAALQALAFHPGDAAMLEIKNWTADLGRQAAEYRTSMADARTALAAGDFARAVQSAGVARTDFPADDAARTLQAQAQAGLDQFHTATNAAALALRQADYATALARSGEALVLVPGDPASLQMQAAAQAGVARQADFSGATNHLWLALAQLDYTNALGWATQALALFPADPGVTRTRADIQLVLDFGARPPADARQLADGRVRRLADASVWTKFSTLEVIAARPPDALVCRPFHWEISLQGFGAPAGRGPLPGANMLGQSAAQPHRARKYDSPPVLLLHYAATLPPSPGTDLTAVRAASVSAASVPGAESFTNLVYDCGVKYSPPATFAEAVARAAQLRAAQSAPAH